jgi:hypothetical protein
MKKLEGKLSTIDYAYSIPRLADMLNRGKPAGSLQTLHGTGGCREIVSLAAFLSSPYDLRS